MKKIVISVTLAVVLILGILGGAALAKTPPDDSPTGIWDSILAGVNEIIDDILGLSDNVSRVEGKIDTLGIDVADTQSMVSGVQTSVDTVQDSVDTVQDSVDTITSNITRMASDTGHYVVSGEAEYGCERILDLVYDQTVHVSLSVIAPNPGNEDQVRANVYISGSSGYAIVLMGVGGEDISGPKTVEFDTNRWTLTGCSEGHTLDVYWAYTVTYPGNVPD